MPNHPVVSRQEWIAARKELLVKEKELTRLRDDLARQRRDLPAESAQPADAELRALGGLPVAPRQRRVSVLPHFLSPDWLPPPRHRAQIPRRPWFMEAIPPLGTRCA